jgi:hypothetical protein
MLYAVKAHYIPVKLAEFYGRLKDGTIRSQKPDGEEICASMERARITEPGIIEWTETCYCSTPLAHERATVYDHYLTDISTREILKPIEFEGDSFIELMRAC